MTRPSMHLDETLQRYVVDHSQPLDAVQTALIARTAKLGRPSGMQIGPEQAALLTILVRMLNAQRAVEVGTFTGFSSLAIARGLAPGGTLLCCDVSKEWTNLAQEAWTEAGLSDRIELRLAPAAETLKSLPTTEHIDFAFIDADKTSYWTYYTELITRLRPGGVIAIDNVLWSGRVADPTPADPDTEALKAFNDRLLADPRVTVVMLPMGDGVTLACKL